MFGNITAEWWGIVFLVVLALGYIIILFYRVTFVIPRRVIRRREKFLTYIARRGGHEVVVPGSNTFSMFDSSDALAKYFRDAEEASPGLGAQHLFCDRQGEITLAGRPVRVAYGWVTNATSDEATKRALYWQAPLRGRLDGWVRLRSANSHFKGAYGAVDVESTDVNREVQLHAYPKKLAYSVFPPDVLLWYIRSSHKPWIYLREDRLIIVAEVDTDRDNYEKFENDVEYLVAAIEKSGALERQSGIA